MARTQGDELISSMKLDDAFEAMKSGGYVQFGVTEDPDCRTGIIRSIHRTRHEKWTATVWNDGDLFTVYFENGIN